MAKRLILLATTAILLAGCASSPQTTLATEEQAATLGTNLVDLGVNNSNLTHDQLIQLQSLNNSVHAALLSLEAAVAAGKSIDTANFDAALAALNSYAASLGVKQ